MKHEVLDSYQQIYVAMCGQQFTRWDAGRRHEKHCPACNAELYSSEDAPDRPDPFDDIETDY
jgi:hypothetical protein